MQIKHALVVDDSKSARFSLKKLLQKQGVKTDFAESAGDALNYLESNRPDVIFMDHLMPGMDGFEAAKAIKANPATNDIPIIMCTSKEGSEYAEQAMAHGAIAILPKPAPEATLTAVLNQLQTAFGKLPQAADATKPTEESASKEAAPAPASGAAVGQRAIEGLVKKLIEEQIASIKKTVDASVEKIINDQLDAKMISTRDKVKEDVARALEPTINESISKVSQRVAHELFNQRFEELKAAALSDVNKELERFEATIEAARKPSPELLEEVKNIAQFTAAHTSGETAKHAAEEISRNIAQDVTQEELMNLKEELTAQFKDDMDGATSSTKMYGIIGAVLAIAAIGMHFVL